nr:transporter [uncultured Brevundimonas sp.]
MNSQNAKSTLPHRRFTRSAISLIRQQRSALERAFGNDRYRDIEMMAKSYLRLAATAALSIMTVGAFGSSASAQAIDAGDYVPAPPGTQLGLLYTQFSHAKGLYAKGDKIDGDAKLDVSVVMPRYVGFTKVGGMTLDYQVLLPFVEIDAGGSTSALGSTRGMGDTILVSTLWLHEDAARKSYFGITPYVYVPTGEYDGAKALNPGENRWKGSLQAVWSKGIGERWVGEVAGDVMVYGSNDDYAGGQKLEQDLTWRVQAFARYMVDDANEANLRLMYVGGGETEINGVAQDNKTGTLSALATWRHTFSPQWQLLSQAGRDLSVEDGFKEAGRVQFRLLRVF